MTQRTLLYDNHKQLGASLVPFAGWDMPVRYSGDKEEHLAVRNGAGLFDVSHMGEFIVRGPHALDLIQYVTSNDAAKITPGNAQYSCFPNHEGGIVDDCIVYCIKEEQYMIVVNAANITKDWEWVSAANTFGAELLDISDKTSLIALSGPKAQEILQPFTDFDLGTLGNYQCWKGTFHGAEKSLIATTGYTGERTFEIFVYNEHVVRVWNDLLEAGRPQGLIPAGLGARDTLRLEMGYMLYGNDINDTTSPLEAGLGWITRLDKGNFIGKAAIEAVKARGLEKKLMGLLVEEKGGIPRRGYQVAYGGEIVSEITSGGISPVTGNGIALAYLPVALAKPGQELDILIRNRTVKATVTRPPFVKK
jgi:aminomethyltransferase